MRRIQESWPCRLSAEGREQNPHWPDRKGTAWHNTRDKAFVRVVWDGLREPLTFAAVLIERVPPEATDA